METKVKRQYDIEIFRIADGEHTFEMEINDAFFALFEYSPVEKGNARVEVVLNKTTRMLTLDVHIAGQVELECDRSLEAFDYPLDINERLIVKYGEEEEELDDDVLVITQNTQKINLAQFIYEIIGISLPMKKIHPDYLEEEDEEEFDEPGDGRLVYSSMEEDEDSEEEEKPEEDTTDPRWAILKNLKNN